MNYDKAHELARAIRESEEYRNYFATHQNVNQDAEAKRMFDDFRKRQFELQMKQMSGQAPTQDEMEQFQRLFETISLNPEIRKLLEAERILSQVMEDINRIIAEPLEVLFTDQI
ncbi:YlbF family regulator [Brevibacillus dissolubilis]|uniref:YlbF family regulator n=1 Tax=Brevibacillus dissolubilis TaxID=1844116 RepID=UPI001116363E|nr:YlbF family regulator [Brevibacillus dissolubilis]